MSKKTIPFQMLKKTAGDASIPARENIPALDEPSVDQWVHQQETAEEMAKYGITRVPADFFCCGGFRYTNLEDAVAQAKRQRCPDGASLGPLRSRREVR